MGPYGLIDNRFRVIKRFGVDSEDIRKQVYLVEDTQSSYSEKVVLKAYMPQEYEDFEREARNNLEMPDNM